MMQNKWQRQVNVESAPTKHLLPTSPNDGVHVHPHASLDEQQTIHDIFGRSTKRPISAPPTSDEGVSMMHGIRNDRFSSSSNHKWGDDLYGSPTRGNHNNAKDFHLPSFNFNHLQDKGPAPAPSTTLENSETTTRTGIVPDAADSTSTSTSTSNQINRMGSESVPPGLGLFTPDNTRTVSPPNTNPNKSHSLYDNSFDVMQIGSRRPASTGVIGHNPKTTTSSSVMESLGLIPSMMDLIQEDFPKTPSPEYQSEPAATNSAQAHNHNHNHSSSSHSLSGANNNSIPESRSFQEFQTQNDFQEPATASTSASQPTASMQYNIQNHSENTVTMPMVPQPNLNFPTAVSNQNFEEKNAVPHHVYSNNVEMQSRPHHNFHQQQVNANLHHDNSRRQGVYQASIPTGLQTIPNANVAHQQHQHHHVIHQQSTYEPQPVYYNTLRGNEVVPGPPRILQTGPGGQHSIYVNSAPYGGYATVQYHQAPPPPNYHHQSPVVIHSHDPASRFISAVPVQGVQAPIPTQVAANGAYIYFHQPANAPAINIVPTNHNRVRGQYKAPAKNTNDRQRKNTRVKKTGSSLGSSESQANNASSVLEEFRAEKSRSWTASDVKGHIVEFCQDQNGSRFIQQRLEVAGEDEKMLIMSDILPEIHKLRIDIFGNYVVQKLFDFGTAKMIEKVKQTIVGDMLILSNQVYGCRVVQKALEIVNDDSLLELLSELHGNVLSCIHDQNGNHVIQKCIEVVNKRASQNEGRGNLEMARLFKHETQIILDCVTEDILALSRHPYGCRVFQRILEHFDEKQKDHILNCICNFHEELLDDQYGNYVIQHVLRFGRTSDRDSVLNIVVKNGLLHLSRQKFASNVVEKLLKYGNDNHRKVIVHEMLKVVQINGMDGNVDESSVVLMMVRDAYANYVVQTTLDVVPEGEEKRLLFEELNSHAALLRNFTFAKHIITKLGAS